MTDSIIKKVKGLFTMSKNKKKKADTGSVKDNTGFEILDDALALDADKNKGSLDESGAIKEETIVEPPVASDGISENEEEIEEIKPESEPKTEKTHERVSRIAAEMNTRGYGL